MWHDSDQLFKISPAISEVVIPKASLKSVSSIAPLQLCVQEFTQADAVTNSTMILLVFIASPAFALLFQSTDEWMKRCGHTGASLI